MTYKIVLDQNECQTGEISNRIPRGIALRKPRNNLKSKTDLTVPTLAEFWAVCHAYSDRELPLKILQFFKDLMKSKRKNKSKLKVKWNVTAKQKKKNDLK